MFFYKFNCTDPGLQLGDPATVCCCGLADILYALIGQGGIGAVS